MRPNKQQRDDGAPKCEGVFRIDCLQEQRIILDGSTKRSETLLYLTRSCKRSCGSTLLSKTIREISRFNRTVTNGELVDEVKSLKEKIDAQNVMVQDELDAAKSEVAKEVSVKTSGRRTKC